jgi:hypothetical protein
LSNGRYIAGTSMAAKEVPNVLLCMSNTILVPC